MIHPKIRCKMGVAIRFDNLWIVYRCLLEDQSPDHGSNVSEAQDNVEVDTSRDTRQEPASARQAPPQYTEIDLYYLHCKHKRWRALDRGFPLNSSVSSNPEKSLLVQGRRCPHLIWVQMYNCITSEKWRFVTKFSGYKLGNKIEHLPPP